MLEKLSYLSGAQVFRFLLGAVIAGVIGYFYLPRVVFTYGSSAVLTARLIPIKSPIPGIIENNLQEIGAEVEKGSVLFSVHNPTVDRSEVEALSLEKKSLMESIETNKKQLIELNRLKETLLENTKKYLKSLTDRTALELEISKQKIAQAKIDKEESKRHLERKNNLVKKGVTSIQESEDASFKFQKSQDYLTQLEVETKKYEMQLSHLGEGIFINTDGRSDVPFQEQKIYEIQIQILNIEKNIEESQHRIKALDQTIQVKNDLFDRLEKATVSSPVKGAVWRVYASNGNYEDKNNVIMDVLDCNNLFMSVSIGARMFETLKLGQKAYVFLSGSQGEIEGEIAYLKGGSLDPKSSDVMVARNTMNKEEEMEVLIKIAPEKLRDLKGDFCNVGRVGDVRF